MIRGVKCFKDGFGSHRYILYIENKPVSALQIEIDSRFGHAVATNVITILSERGKGHAIRVYKEALKHHDKIIFSKNRSELGKIYVKKCETIKN